MIAAMAKGRAACSAGGTGPEAAAEAAADFVLGTPEGRPSAGSCTVTATARLPCPGCSTTMPSSPGGSWISTRRPLRLATLKTALELADNTIDHFHDEKDGVFFTADDGVQILFRQKDSYDGAIPSGNSVIMLDLLRLSRITGRSDLEQKAIGVSRAFARNIGQILGLFASLMVALEFLAGPSFEIVVAGKPGRRTRKRCWMR
ncbi:MAG: hypothetical protein MZV70_12970 [Desulfobacterales bacterium]|nr:hypothetical protein [Desulfobacterales bacterium]